MLALHWSNNGGDDQQDYLQSFVKHYYEIIGKFFFAFYVIHFTNDIGRYSAVLYGI